MKTLTFGLISALTPGCFLTVVNQKSSNGTFSLAAVISTFFTPLQHNPLGDHPVQLGALRCVYLEKQ